MAIDKARARLHLIDLARGKRAQICGHALLAIAFTESIERLHWGNTSCNTLTDYRYRLTRWFERHAPPVARAVTFLMTAVFALLLLAAGRAWVQ
jgi:hypothetical protein